MMWTNGGAVLCLAAIAALAPGAAAQESAAFTMNFTAVDRLVFTLVTTVSGQDAAEFREAFDQDDDGNISESENQQAQMLLGSGAGSAAFDNDTFKIDGKGASQVELESSSMSDLTGPTSSQEPIDITVVQEFLYDVTAGPSHRLTFGEEDEEPDPNPDAPLSYTVRAPPGYVISEVDEDLEGTLSSDRKSLTAETTSGEANAAGAVFIVFQREGEGDKKDTPGPGWAAAVGVALLAWVALRGRRREP